MSYRLYLVEDEHNLNQVLTTYLQKEGWDVTSFYNGETARKAIGSQPHLWILDIMLPDIDGYQLIREIKANSPKVPVIFISARDADIDRVIGLELGSDDYLAKPFLPRELVIRSRKLLERIYAVTEDGVKNTTLILGEYVIDENRRMVTLGNVVIDLTSKEFNLLLYLMKNQGLALSRNQVIFHVWGEDYFGTDRVVDDLVRRLRKKMPELKVETLYGYGYRMVNL
ncbi:DNA-binding response regulator [Desulfuribacillus stibiiarsenatis]|uniref:DNA-binding response regulator n=1 Tax=Desulfuribacillus stibiiarsenatis TaxID=1390249 RepID=A0A1E5L8G7_9FIRM|nr:response regulator transcription factor [Desulfuribacillus stibiiarsenatis]OEH86435.1 DNA-binding response regulator [Desulfuribacillus stibiiarsenatis]